MHKEIQYKPQLQSEFKASLGYIVRLCFKAKQNNQINMAEFGFLGQIMHTTDKSITETDLSLISYMTPPPPTKYPIFFKASLTLSFLMCKIWTIHLFLPNRVSVEIRLGYWAAHTSTQHSFVVLVVFNNIHCHKLVLLVFYS
jgi:hypothetical protein